MVSSKVIGFACIISLFNPLIVLGESGPISCESARTQLKETQQTLLSLENAQRHIQNQVQAIYKEMFSCLNDTTLPGNQLAHCAQLQKQGSNNFQDLIATTTLTHQMSQQLAQVTHQVRRACPAKSADSFPQITSLPRP